MLADWLAGRTDTLFPAPYGEGPNQVVGAAK
jgi:hypothetical protein